MIGGTGPSGPENVRPGLSRIVSAYSRSGHPEKAFHTLQVAGTNGKGSTACFAYDVLRLLPLGSIGLYTSPHLVAPEERIRIDGKMISPRALRSGFRDAERLSPAGDPLTWFEKMTWCASDWFRRKGVRIAVMETGLGGRWDATTACSPVVSVITTVGYDHQEWLGKTLGSIASEKAGILRRGIPLVTGRLRPAARAVVLRSARRLGCSTWELGRTFDWRVHRDGTIAVALPGLDLEGLRVGRIGVFQRDNAAIALAASWVLASAKGIGPNAFAVAATIALRDSKWPGRWCPLPLRKNDGVWVDGGHNPEAASAVAREISGVPPWGKGKAPGRPVEHAFRQGRLGVPADSRKIFRWYRDVSAFTPERGEEGGARGGVRGTGDRLPSRGRFSGRMADRTSVGREGRRRARVRFARRCRRRLPVPRRVRPLNPFRRLLIALLLIGGGVSVVYAEARFPLPSTLKDLTKPGIRLNAPVHMTADKLSYDEDTGVAMAEGNVELVFGTRTMRADRVRYDSTTGEADLTGKVHYKDTGEEFAFDRIKINIDSETGILYNGTIRISSSNYLICEREDR